MRDLYSRAPPGQAPVSAFNITLGYWGSASWATAHFTERVQPVLLRAPEVLLKASRDRTADLWNLGAVILEVFRGVRMFETNERARRTGHTD